MTIVNHSHSTVATHQWMIHSTHSFSAGSYNPPARSLVAPAVASAPVVPGPLPTAGNGTPKHREDKDVIQIHSYTIKGDSQNWEPQSYAWSISING